MRWCLALVLILLGLSPALGQWGGQPRLSLNLTTYGGGCGPGGCPPPPVTYGGYNGGFQGFGGYGGGYQFAAPQFAPQRPVVYFYLQRTEPRPGLFGGRLFGGGENRTTIFYQSR